MRKIFISILLSNFVSLYSLDTLAMLGQTPGGSAFRTEIKDGRLYAGVGTSLWIYDAENPLNDSVLAKKKFMSVINDIVVLPDTTVIVAANHDGLWALDAKSLPDLPVKAYLETPGDTYALDIEFVPPDTIYLVDGFCVRVLHYTGNSFEEITRFSQAATRGVSRRGNRIVVTRVSGFYGFIDLYNTDSLSLIYTKTLFPPEGFQLERVYFANLRDDIVYVCAGTNNAGYTGHFYAFQIESDTLKESAHYTIYGHPWPLASFAYITDLDLRNDTIFLVTTAGELNWYTTDCPVLDGTKLPDSLPVIAHIKPGLWFFDVALKDTLLVIASEWYGIRWMNIAGLWRGDTIFDDSDTLIMHRTGGWGKKPFIKNDTLWLAWEGYGVGIFDVFDSSNPVQIGRIPGPFASDFAFYDTLIFVAKGTYNLEVFNLSPWHRGGEPEFVKRIKGRKLGVQQVLFIPTNSGPRIAFTCSNIGFYIIDPRDYPNYDTLGHFFNTSRINDFKSKGDTIYIAYGNRIAVVRLVNDSLVLLADTTAGSSDTTFCIGFEGSLVAVGVRSGDNHKVLIYELSGDSFMFRALWNTDKKVHDIVIRDTLIYVSQQGGGLVVLKNPNSPVLKALFPGSGGRRGIYGAQKIYIDSDGKIYLADFFGGCFIVEPAYVNVEESRSYQKEKISNLKVSLSPFNVRIIYYIPKRTYLNIKVYDALGRLVDVLYKGRLEKGPHVLVWDRKDKRNKEVMPGVYFIRIKEKGGNYKNLKINLIK